MGRFGTPSLKTLMSLLRMFYHWNKTGNANKNRLIMKLKKVIHNGLAFVRLVYCTVKSSERRTYLSAL